MLQGREGQDCVKGRVGDRLIRGQEKEDQLEDRRGGGVGGVSKGKQK